MMTKLRGFLKKKHQLHKAHQYDTSSVSKKGTSKQRSGKGAIIKRFSLQKPRWDKKKITIKYLYHEKVQVGKDQEKAQSEKESRSKNRVGEKQTNVTGKVLHRIIVLLVRFVLLARFGLLNFGLFLYSWVNKFFAPF